MRKILLLLCIPFIGLAQTDYELEFNSTTQDYVQMSNASSVITNKIAFSMSALLYPQANPSAHSGIMGFSIVNVLGTESKGTRNEPLFYIYDDGAVEKQIIVE